MSVSSAPTSSHVGRRTLRVNLVSLLVVAAAIAGLLVGGALPGSEAPRPRPATASQPIVHDGLRLQLPRGWTRGDAATVPGFRHPLQLRNSDDGLRASAEQLPATSPTLLPAALLATLNGGPEPPASVRVAGGHPAWRYRIPGRDGSMTLVYTAPTTSGIATVACTSPLDSSVPRACDALAGAVTVPGSRPLAPSTSAAFLSRLPAVVSDLDSARAKGLEALDTAPRARGQALAAEGLGRAHKVAAGTLAPLASGGGVPSATVGALTATATAYATLASAARNRLPGPYADAGRGVTSADADLRKAVAKVAAATSAATRTASQAASTPVRQPATSGKSAVTKDAAKAPAQTPTAKTPATTTRPTESSTAKTQPTESSKAKTQQTESSTAKTPVKAQPKERPASKAPADKRSAERAAVEAPAKARPAATAAGADLTLPLLVLASAVALFFAIRGARRAVGSPTQGP